MAMYKGNRRPRVDAWMIGYYAAKQEELKGLIDIPLEDIDKRYIFELAKRAERETRHLVRIRDRASVTVDNAKTTT